MSEVLRTGFARDCARVRSEALLEFTPPVIAP